MNIIQEHELACDVLVAGGGPAGVPCALAAARNSFLHSALRPIFMHFRRLYFTSVPAPDVGVWRGMGHHSQFRCVVVTNPADLAAPRTE